MASVCVLPPREVERGTNESRGIRDNLREGGAR